MQVPRGPSQAGKTERCPQPALLHQARGNHRQAISCAPRAAPQGTVTLARASDYGMLPKSVAEAYFIESSASSPSSSKVVVFKADMPILKSVGLHLTVFMPACIC